jgi:hypothetical protein
MFAGIAARYGCVTAHGWPCDILNCRRYGSSEGPKAWKEVHECLKQLEKGRSFEAEFRVRYRGGFEIRLARCDPYAIDRAKVTS